MTDEKQTAQRCDGSNHGRYANPCSEFECDDCGGPMCQETSRPVQFAVGSTGFVCKECAPKYPHRRVSRDGLAVAWGASSRLARAGGKEGLG